MDLTQIWNLSLHDLTKGYKSEEMKMTSNRRRLKLEDDLKISKVDYLSNHCSDLTQILNLSLQDLTKEYKGIK